MGIEEGEGNLREAQEHARQNLLEYALLLKIENALLRFTRETKEASRVNTGTWKDFIREAAEEIIETVREHDEEVKDTLNKRG